MFCDFEIIDDGNQKKLRCRRPGCVLHDRPRPARADGRVPQTPCSGRDAPEKPPLWRQGFSFLRAALQHVYHGLPQTEQDRLDTRLAVCRLCDRFDGEHCRQCGCNISTKAAWALEKCPLQKWPGEKKYLSPEQRPADFYLSLQAGLGDAVQFTQVIERLGREYPDAAIELHASWPRVYEGLLPGMTSDGRPRLKIVEQENGEYRNQARWPEPRGVFPDAPATKAQHCLLRDFGRAPESSQYRFTIRDDERAHVAGWVAASQLSAISPKLTADKLKADGPHATPLVLLHFSGVSWSAEKNFPLAVITAAVKSVLDAGGVPLLLDANGALPAIPGAVRVPAHVTPGVGELAALIEAVDLFVGIDSGPGHLAGAVRGSSQLVSDQLVSPEGEPKLIADKLKADGRPRPTIIVWREFHPLHYFPADNGVLHLVPADHQRLIRGGDAKAVDYFSRAYRHATYLDPAHGIARAIRQTLRGEPVSSVDLSRDKPLRLLWEFFHGLGDHVQLTITLEHIRQQRPDWSVDLCCRPGMESLFAQFAPQVRVITLTEREKIDPLDYDVVDSRVHHEPDRTIDGAPSTKSELALLRYGLVPDPRLCRYRRPRTPFLRAVHPRPYVLIHFAGISVPEKKNLPEPTLGAVEEWCRNRQIDLVSLQGITMEPGRIVALAERAAACIGIDSGPGHVFGSVDTPTAIYWSRHHPVNYYGLSPNVTHFIPPDAGEWIKGDRATGERFFRDHYRYQVYRDPTESLIAWLEETIGAASNK